MRSKSGTAVAVILATLTVWATRATAQQGEGPPPATVRLGVAMRQTVQNQRQVVGRLQQVRQSTVASEVSGKIIEVAVEAGDAVVGGETVLAKVDPVWAEIAVRSAEADLEATRADLREAEARFEKAQTDLARLSELLKSGAARQREFDEAKATHDAERARVSAATSRISTAEATLARARNELERLVIVAPFDGVIVRKLIEVGEWAEKGTAVVEMVSRGQIDAVIDVPERLINNIVMGAELEVFVEALGSAVSGKVIAIVPQGAAASRTFPVKIRLDDQNGKLMSGMSVLAHVPTSDRIEAITVPRDAVLQTPRGTVVWASINGSAVQVPVEVMFGQGERYAVKVLDGSTTLADQTPVVIEGAERIVMPGQPLMVVPDTAARSE